MDKRRGKKELPQLGSEIKPSDALAHERLAHEDKDPIYPIDPIIDDSPKGKKRKPN